MNAKASKPFRVRFAPSPTGYLHIGSARTALFNWLFARHNNGKFILRIEDTDLARSTPEFEKIILSGLKWLGLDYDEGPYRQSERTELYKGFVQKLLDANSAYYCFCSKEDLESIRQSAAAAGQPSVYNGRCRSLTDAEVKKKMAAGSPAVIRFKMGTEKISFTDGVRGDVTFDARLIGDFVIAKDLATPLFLLSNVIDDSLMEITHVIRGEDHLANTPKQLALQKALGFSSPIYSHIPLILNSDKSKMSKRDGAASVEDYQALGYLPEAVVNFIALLGWHPSHDEEILSREQLVAEFDLGRVQKSGAIFNTVKLDAFNNHYLRQKSIAELVQLVKASGNGVAKADPEALARVIPLFIERAKTVRELGDYAFGIIDLVPYEAKLLVWKKSNSQAAIENLEAVKQAIDKVSAADFKKAAIEAVLMPLAEGRGRGEVLWPLRVALSGKEMSPGPFELLEALGKEESLRRLDTAVKKFNGARSPFKE